MGTKISEYTGNMKGALARLTSGLIFDKASGIGIKVDTTTPTFPWHDIIGSVSANGNPASQPSLADYNATGIYQYQFAVGEEIAHVFHMPHDYVPGTDMFIHAHWSHDEIPTDNFLIWSFKAFYGKRDGVFGSAIQVLASGTAGTTPLVHHVDEVQFTSAIEAATSFDRNDMEVDGLIIVRTELSSNGSGKDPFLHTVDLHYQSTGIGTKNSADPFYT